MKRTFLLSLCALSLLSPAWASRRHSSSPTRVRSYVTKRGTVVTSHYRSHEDKSFTNNWSTKPNVNPYTGKRGTRVSPPRKR